MIKNYRLTRSGWALVVVGVAALALGGCGRKGPLDLPTATPSSTADGPKDTETERAREPSVFNPTYGSDSAPAAAKGRKKPFLLDPILD